MAYPFFLDLPFLNLLMSGIVLLKTWYPICQMIRELNSFQTMRLTPLLYLNFRPKTNIEVSLITSFLSIWLQSNLSVAPLYWYVVALEVWRKPHYESHVSDPMYHPMKMAIARLWKCCYTALHATSNPIGHYRIFRIIIYSWHKVTLMWPVMGFPKIYNAATSVKVSGWEIWF